MEGKGNSRLNLFCNKLLCISKLINNFIINHSKIIYTVAFILYIVLTFFGALNHELWFDEAQAWNIARENDIAGIFATMKYEGHPALWHLILYFFIHIGATAEILPFISWFVSVITVGIIILKAPFHPVMKIAMVFSSGFLFYNSVISRTYCILQLILCIIACIYPKRCKHPIMYGICIALLANTHICIWGLIAALGICMIVELFKEFRTSTKKENISKIIGLIIAGLGVVALILPLIGCITSNYIVAGKTNSFSISYIVDSILNFNNDILSKYIFYDGSSVYFFLSVLSVLLVFFFVLFRHSKKYFLILVSFVFGYYICCGVIWYSNSNRAALFFYSIFLIVWLFKQEEKIYNKKRIPQLKYDHKITKSIAEFTLKCDSNWLRTCCIIITAINIFSISSGLICTIQDYTMLFSPQKVAADYIKENISKDVVFLTFDDGDGVVLSAYLPDYNFYSLDCESFSKFKLHKKIKKYHDIDNINSDLSSYKEIYLIRYYATKLFEYPNTVFEINDDEYMNVSSLFQPYYMNISKIDSVFDIEFPERDNWYS